MSDDRVASCATDDGACSPCAPWWRVQTMLEGGLALLFLWAAFNKLRPPNGPQLFSDSVHAFKLGLPDVLVRLSTSVTPWVEAIAGVLLLLGIWRRAAAAVLAMLLVVFIALIVQALARGLNVECGCFGKLSPFCPPKVGMCNIVQNSVMLAVALAAVFTRQGKA